jgi:hypothetical protein
MAVSPRLATGLVPIVPFDGFFVRLSRLSPEAFKELKNLLRKIQMDGPYCSELVDQYQTDFDLDTFTCFSSRGFSLEWHVDASPFIDDDKIAIPRLRVLLTDLQIVGNHTNRVINP